MPSSDQAAVPQDVVIHYDVPCTLSDGTVLRADVARPAGEGRWPVILARTPYGKAVAPGFTTDLTHGARHGYVTIIQDVRGRGTSDGKADFQPWVDEGRDGAEVVEWAAALPYSNGRVYMSGPSYLGFVQWAAAAEQPPSLQAINPIVPVGHFNRSFIYCSGVFELELNGYWWTMLGVEELMRRDWDSPEARTEAIARAGALLEALARDGGYNHLPLNRFEPVKHSAQGAQLFALLKNGIDDPSMKASARANEYENITVPALIVAGWYDIFIRGSIDQFVGLRSRARSDGARTKSRLIVGPWAHHPQSKMTGEQILPGSAAIQALNPAYSSGSVSRVGGSGVSDCFDVGKWVSRPVLQRGNLCHGPHPPGAMIARRDFRFQRSGARRSQPRSTEVGSPRMAVFCCWHRPSARWGFAGGLRLALPIRGTLCG
ncbi:hypothetical protein M529_23105 [Sphingobium ummariense RL-3]|uniref:Xaa-Pro dipeptidyl-peptidase-like domain-containing protein n=1 Tax=Sphingobium ummariense RL-3 TaxID=1346791 RepID=T0JZL7_9SPHN|nr:hypothetical protein M529_23105 [Sphingobium ummariense RL-3]